MIVGTTPLRVPLVAGNWKMYKTSGEGASLLRDLAARLGKLGNREVLVFPSFVGLPEAVKAVTGTAIAIGAQDVFWADEGAYTGEVAPGMLAAIGVRNVLVGHSERRQYFGETDEWVTRKVRAALDGGLAPLICVGESSGEREQGRTEEVLSREIHAALSAVRSNESPSVTLAYEPIWAIGTGKTATPEIAQKAISFCRETIEDALGQRGAETIRVLYGGSVKPNNIDDLMAQPDIDGVLVGGASLDLEAFCRIIEFEVR